MRVSFENRASPHGFVHQNFGILRRWIAVTLLAATTALGATSGEGASMDAGEAVKASQKAAIPDYGALQGNTDAQAVIGREAGDTTGLKALRQTGAEKLYAPGRTDVDACYAKDGTRCSAVVIVDRGAANRPTVDPDPTGDVRKAVNLVKESASSTVSGITSSVGSCRRVKQTVRDATSTHTCDIRTVITGGGTTETYIEKYCSVAFRNITERQSRFKCTITNYREWIETLAVPVVPAYSVLATLTCYEGTKDPETRTCSVTQTTTEKTKFVAVCVRPKYRKTVKTCTRRLLVDAKASCTPGEVVVETLTDSAALKEDGVPGCDTLEVAYVCKQENTPSIRIGTNATTGGTVDAFFTTADTPFDMTKDMGGNALRFTGTITCTDSACLADVTMTVYLGKGNDRVLMGSLHKGLAFTKFTVTEATDHWEETCE